MHKFVMTNVRCNNVSKLLRKRNFSFIKKNHTTILKSSSNCVFENLALEDFIYENVTFKDNERLLLFWRNRPCIVIGRHQNPWLEINLQKIKDKDISVCRRKSGGGTVYHDLGNINLSFFSHKEIYNRAENLDFIIDALRNNYKFEVSRNKKDDILLRDAYKVSGTAAKLGLHNCYHHCTLLCQSDLKLLNEILKNPFAGINTNATKSVSSLTENLFEKEKYSYNDIVDSLSLNYSQKFGKLDKNISLQSINPRLFPDVIKKSKDLASWEWTYAKSPKFTFRCTITLPDDKINEYFLDINKGIICHVKLEGDCDTNVLDILKTLIGTRFNKDDILKTFNSQLTHEQSLKYVETFSKYL